MSENGKTSTNAMDVEITKEDFEEYLGDAQKDREMTDQQARITAGFFDKLKRPKTDLIEKSKEMEELRDLLPKVVAKKIAKRVPIGFVFAEMKFVGEVKGQPFGIGIAGSVEVTFRKP